MGIFDMLSSQKECPNPYTREDMERDIHPERINKKDLYKDTIKYKRKKGSTRNYFITPLKCAMMYSKDEEIIAELLRNGADVNWVRGIVNETVGDLFYIYGEQNKSLLKILINAGLDLNAKGRWKDTLLYNLIDTRDIELIQLMLESGVNVNLGNSHRNTPLSRASATDSSEVVKLLLRYGAEVNTINTMNCTPLYESILGGQSSVVLAFGNKKPHLDVIKILINAGADVNAVCNNTSILDLANEVGDDDVIKALLDVGAYVRI